MPFVYDTENLNDRLNRMINAFEDGNEDMIEDFTKAISIDQGDNFLSEGEDFDKPWASLAPSTIRDKEIKGYGSKQKLVRTKELKKSRGSRIVSNKQGEIFYSEPYAIYHQFGTVKMPQRKILDVGNDKVRETLESFVNKWIIKLKGE